MAGVKIMKTLRKNPHIYEINLMTWLSDLTRREGREINLRNIPKGEWEHLKRMGMDLIWLMGVWERSPHSVDRAQNAPQLVEACQSILKDFKMHDIVGSPYAVHDYVPDSRFGSCQDLLALKDALEYEGLLLILDFVPNHTACDHPWVRLNPQRYIQGDMSKGSNCKEGFFAVDTVFGKRCIAHGKDPYFPPWTDTAQINYGHPESLEAMVELLAELSSYCHGLRCDMAMLVLGDVFQDTWGPFLKDVKDVEEFWPPAIEGLRYGGRECFLIAETYWGKEAQLFDLGFDYAYDKNLYDLMVRRDIQGLRHTLSTRRIADQQRMLRFLENHDEPRAMEAFGRDKIKAAMLIHATLPGMRFWQHGQFEGSCIRTPVQLRRAPVEPVDHDLLSFSEMLLTEVSHPVFHEGVWEMCHTAGWVDNPSHEMLLAWCWGLDDERRLVVINLSDSSIHGYIKMPPEWLTRGENFLLSDPLKGDSYLGSRSELETSGLYVGLEKGDFHFFRVKRG
jgi:hypothetical protein